MSYSCDSPETLGSVTQEVRTLIASLVALEDTRVNVIGVQNGKLEGGSTIVVFWISTDIFHMRHETYSREEDQAMHSFCTLEKNMYKTRPVFLPTPSLSYSFLQFRQRGNVLEQ
ncbi:hypothetical protein HPB48_022304 [Haemaphysalis longicornis]|uniref:Uncharacterized protein n=1 Tax=Haemaphysalis longicornis TaxID=44386 RepID=A0A9J6FFX0_HAELO|nr:hypothetical protein HPB48_022304 [Haemaphysalis longicornis]